MPAPHDLDPLAMTEEERLAKRRQQAAIAWEMHCTRLYNELHAQRLAQIAEELASAGEPLDREMGDCVLCGEDPEYVSAGDPERPWAQKPLLSSHAAGCPYRMASEFVDARTAHHTMPKEAP